MKIHNPILFCVFLAFALANLLDLYFGTRGTMIAEANPIWLLTGSKMILIIAKLAIVILAGLIVLVPTWGSRIAYYMFLLALVLGTIMFSIGAWTGYAGEKAIAESPDMGVEISQTPSMDKAKEYGLFVLFIYIIPIFFCIFVFYLYDKSQKYVTYGKVNKQWWKFWRKE